MNDPLGNVVSGNFSPFVTSLRTVNAVLDAARAQREANQGNKGGGPLTPDALVPANIVLVSNNAGGTWPEWTVLAPTGFVIDPDTYPFDCRRKPVFTGAAPVTDSDPVLITLEPIANGAIGRAAAAGVTVCYVNVTDTAHRFARPIPGNLYQLESAPSGPACLLTPSGAGVYKTFVLLGKPPSIGVYPVEITGTFNASTGYPWKALVLDVPDVVDKAPSVTGNKLFEVSGNQSIETGTKVLAWPNGDGWLFQLEKVRYSVDRDPAGLQLVNDQDAPGSNKLYGTDGGGVKGWFDRYVLDLTVDSTVTLDRVENVVLEMVDGEIALRVIKRQFYFDRTAEGIVVDVREAPTASSEITGTIPVCLPQECCDALELTASFVADDTTVNVMDPVTFTPTVGGGIEPYAYFWDFGDNDNSIEETPTHNYTDPGTYDVTLVVTDACGRVVEATAVQVVVSGSMYEITTGDYVGVDDVVDVFHDDGLFECSPCDTAPTELSITVSGIADAFCTECEAFNGTHTLTADPEAPTCIWSINLGPLGCATDAVISFTWDSVNSNWKLSFSGTVAVYTADSWDCASGGLVLDLGSSTGGCSGWPSTMTINLA